MATLKGLGVVWGANIGVSLTASLKVQSATLTRESDRQLIRGVDGEAAGEVYYNPTHTFRINVIPSAATIASAVTAATTLVTAPGTQVTITDADGNADGSSGTGKYILVSATENRVNDNVLSVDLEMVNYSTDLSATISS